MSGGQRSLLKKKLQVCEICQKSCLFVGDQILIFHHNLQINSLKILQCDFLDFVFLILSVIVEVYLWWKLPASLIFLSGRTCTIGGWLNTFLPHCIYLNPALLNHSIVWDFNCCALCVSNKWVHNPYINTYRLSVGRQKLNPTSDNQCGVSICLSPPVTSHLHREPERKRERVSEREGEKERSNALFQ